MNVPIRSKWTLKVCTFRERSHLKPFYCRLKVDLHSVVNSAAYFNENAQNSMDDYVASLSGLKVKDMDMYFVVSTDGITNYVSGKPNLQLVKKYVCNKKNANMSVGIKELDKDLVFFNVCKSVNGKGFDHNAGVNISQSILEDIILIELM